MLNKPGQLLRIVNNRALIFSTSLLHEAHLVKDRLTANHIDALILNQQDSMYKAFGMIEVYVQLQDEEKAKKLISELF